MTVTIGRRELLAALGVYPQRAGEAGKRNK
jgi:hypothetical protein